MPFDLEAYMRDQETFQMLDNEHKPIPGQTPANLVKVQASKPRTVQSYPAPTGRVQQRATPGVADPSAHYLAEMQRIADLQDPQEKFFEVTKLRGSVEATLAKFRKTADEQASSEFGVQALAATLAENEAADKADPNYAKFQSDSKITQKVRMQYDAALSASKARAASIYDSNPEAAKLVGMVSPFLEYSMRSLARQEAKADDRAAKEAALAEQFGTGHLELAKLIAPGADPVQTAAREYKNIAFREAAIAMRTPEDLLYPALSGRNPYAKAGVIHKQAVLLAGTEDTNSSQYQHSLRQAEGEFRDMQKLVKDGAYFQARVNEMFPNKEQRNKLLGEYIILGEDPSKMKDREMVRASLAPMLLSKAKESQFLGNVAGWEGSEALTNPSNKISSVYTTVQGKVGAGAPISLSALASGIRDLPPEEQARARDELVAIAKGSLQRTATGIYGGFGDGLDIETFVNTRMADTILEDFFGNIRNRALLGTGVGAAIGAVVGPIGVGGGAILGTGAMAVVGTAESVANLLNRE